MAKQALIVIDMINDFFTGSLACPRLQNAVPACTALVEAARKKGVPVIWACDAHYKGIDKELALWGEHALINTEGARIIPALQVKDSDYIIPKRRYSAFFETGLELLLRELGVDSLIFAGVLTNLCVQHSVCDAFYWGYDITVASDATEALEEGFHKASLEAMKTFYGAKLMSAAEIAARM